MPTSNELNNPTPIPKVALDINIKAKLLLIAGIMPEINTIINPIIIVALCPIYLAILLLISTDIIMNNAGIVVKFSTTYNGTSGKVRDISGILAAMQPPETTINDADNIVIFLINHFSYNYLLKFNLIF